MSSDFFSIIFLRQFPSFCCILQFTFCFFIFLSWLQCRSFSGLMKNLKSSLMQNEDLEGPQRRHFIHNCSGIYILFSSSPIYFNLLLSSQGYRSNGFLVVNICHSEPTPNQPFSLFYLVSPLISFQFTNYRKTAPVNPQRREGGNAPRGHSV